VKDLIQLFLKSYESSFPGEYNVLRVLLMYKLIYAVNLLLSTILDIAWKFQLISISTSYLCIQRIEEMTIITIFCVNKGTYLQKVGISIPCISNLVSF
jgi:hypothetical protein